MDYEKGSLRPIFFSPESYPRYVGSARSVPEYYGTGNASDEFQAIGFIPQLEHTYGYLEDTYGALNENQVSDLTGCIYSITVHCCCHCGYNVRIQNTQVGIGESTCSGIFGSIPLGMINGTALLSIDQLTQIAMERSSSARQAITIMGSLAEEYGFYGAGEFEGTAESLAVSDVEEVWIFHILPDPTGSSAIWAAQRIPENSFSVLANMFVIRDVDPLDEDNFLMSDSVHSVAKDYGWWDETTGEKLDFTKIYSDGEYAHKYYSGRRMWGAYHLACPSCNYSAEYIDLQSDPVYPVYTVPDEKLSQLDLFKYHRYTYQGTKYDLGAVNNLAGGPWGTPDRYKAGKAEMEVGGNWERAIGLYRTSDTYVVSSRSDTNSTGAVLWFAPASPLGSVFTPFLVNVSDVPASFRSGHQAVFDRSSAFWAACVVANVANLKWSYAIRDIEERQAKLERASVEMIERMDEIFAASGDFAVVEEEYLKNVDDIVTSLWRLSDEILFKYASGFVNEPPDAMSQMVGYPSWWLKAVGYSDGPPPPPTQPKCCHPKNDKEYNSVSVSGSDSSSLRGGYNQEEVFYDGSSVLTGKAAMKHHLKIQKELQ